MQLKFQSVSTKTENVLCILAIYLHNKPFGVLKMQTFENWFQGTIFLKDSFVSV